MSTERDINYYFDMVKKPKPKPQSIKWPDQYYIIKNKVVRIRQTETHKHPVNKVSLSVDCQQVSHFFPGSNRTRENH